MKARRPKAGDHVYLCSYWNPYGNEHKKRFKYEFCVKKSILTIWGAKCLFHYIFLRIISDIKLVLPKFSSWNVSIFAGGVADLAWRVLQILAWRILEILALTVLQILAWKVLQILAWTVLQSEYYLQTQRFSFIKHGTASCSDHEAYSIFAKDIGCKIQKEHQLLAWTFAIWPVTLAAILF